MHLILAKTVDRQWKQKPNHVFLWSQLCFFNSFLQKRRKKQTIFLTNIFYGFVFFFALDFNNQPLKATRCWLCAHNLSRPIQNAWNIMKIIILISNEKLIRRHSFNTKAMKPRRGRRKRDKNRLKPKIISDALRRWPSFRIHARAHFASRKASTPAAAARTGLHCHAYTPLMASVEYEPTRMQSNSLDFAFDSRRKWEKNKTDMKIKPKQQKQQRQQQQHNVMWARIKTSWILKRGWIVCAYVRSTYLYLYLCVYASMCGYVCVCICNIAFNIESRRTWHRP